MVVSFLQDEAFAEPVSKAASGDVNADGEFNISDVVIFQKWLLGSAKYSLADWKAADFCSDGKLDIFDLTHMKKELIKIIDMSYVNPEIELEYGPRFLCLD